MIAWTYYVFFFVTGTIIGSFLNVVGLRLLREESIVFPASRCFSCDMNIKPFDNIPILSWFLLKGKCRNCNAPISVQYPIVELLSGVLFLGVYLKFGISIQGVFILYLLCNLIVIIITDFRDQYIYDINSIGLIPFGLAYTFFNLARVPGEKAFSMGGYLNMVLPEIFVSALIAVLGAFVIFFLLNLISKLLIGSPGFGEGDTRLLMGIGAFFGLKLMVVVFVLSFIVQTLVGIPMLLVQWIRKKAYKIVVYMVGAFMLALLPYLLQIWITNVFAALGIALILGIIAFILVMKAISMSKELPGGLTYLPFGPAIVFAAILMIFAGDTILLLTS